MPVSALMAGSRMLTADVLALTTSVDRHVTMRTPRARVATSVLLIGTLTFAEGCCGRRASTPRTRHSALGEPLDEECLGDDHPLDLGRVDALVGRVDPGAGDVLGTPQDELGARARRPGGCRAAGWSRRCPPRPTGLPKASFQGHAERRRTPDRRSCTRTAGAALTRLTSTCAPHGACVSRCATRASSSFSGSDPGTIRIETLAATSGTTTLDAPAMLVMSTPIADTTGWPRVGRRRSRCR